jgi:hypothetical protein
MQKLTKEQADWLIERFSKTHWAQDMKGGLYQGDIRNIINECTEKKFPELHLSILDADNDPISSLNLTKCTWCNDSVTRLHLIDPRKGDEFGVDIRPLELKILYDGIGRILEHINEY